MSIKPVRVDSGKFLSTINNSVQSKLALYESAVKMLGKKAGKNWRLASLNSDKLYIEDCDSNRYYEAAHTKAKGGRINITGIAPLELVENKKSASFENNCLSLVNAIHDNDQKGMKAAFNNLAAQRFTSHTIPSDGIVKTRDGAIRHIAVATEGFDDSFKTKLVSALVESVTNDVIMENGVVVGASILNERKSLPVSEWTCCKVIGEKMRSAAKSAYLSEGFQNRVYSLAQMIVNDKVKDAVSNATKFLANKQEFSLLTKKEMQRLTENTLATKGIMNDNLCKDLATLLYRSSVKVNKNDIIKEWKRVAKKAQHPTLLENVNALETSKNIEVAYDRFLNMAFGEAISPRDEEINAYRAALSLLQNTRQVREDSELKTKIDDLVTKMSNKDVDSATVGLVREALAAAKKEVDQIQNLDDFDEIPGDSEAADLGNDLSDAVDNPNMVDGVPNIVINAPLIQVGGSDSTAPPTPQDTDMAAVGDDSLEGLDDLDDLGGDELEDDATGDDDESSDDIDSDDLESLLNSDEDEEEEEDDVYDKLDLASKQHKKSVVEDKEWLMNKIKGKKDDADKSEECDEDTEDCDVQTESSDPYGFNDSVSEVLGLGIGYGNPVLEDEIPTIVSTLINLAEDRELDEAGIANQFIDLVKIAIHDNGIRIPSHKLEEAVQLIVNALNEKVLGEDQYKWGTAIRKHGFGRNRFNSKKARGGNSSSDSGFSGSAPDGSKRELSGELSGDLPNVQESVEWFEHDKKNYGISGKANGVNFILDYSTPAIITNMAGNVEVPVPSSITESAYAAIGLKSGNKKLFLDWLNNNVEQLREASADEDAALNEAIAVVTAHGDGTVEVEVNGDVDVNEQGLSDVESDDLADPMAPVDDLGGSPVDNVEDEDGAMPDFENGPEAAEFTPPADGPEVDSDVIVDADGDTVENDDAAETDEDEVEDEDSDEDDESPVTEDHDITDPGSSSYDTTDEDLRSTPKEGGKAQKPNKGNKLDGFELKSDTTGKTDTKMKKVDSDLS